MPAQMDTTQLFAIAAALGWASGLRLYAVVFLTGLAFEAIGDAQLTAFRRDPSTSGQVMDRGLWSWSRHPNYFGEFSFWLSLALFGVAAAPADSWWLVLGAVAILAMFLGASIPMMEKRQSRKPAYADYQKRVSMLVPLPAKR